MLHGGHGSSLGKNQHESLAGILVRNDYPILKSIGAKGVGSGEEGIHNVAKEFIGFVALTLVGWVLRARSIPQWVQHQTEASRVDIGSQPRTKFSENNFLKFFFFCKKKYRKWFLYQVYPS